MESCLKELKVVIPKMEEKKHDVKGSKEWYENDKNHVRVLTNQRGLFEQLLAKDVRKKIVIPLS